MVLSEAAWLCRLVGRSLTTGITNSHLTSGDLGSLTANKAYVLMIVSAVLRCEVWQHGASPLGREVRNQWLDGQWHEDMGETGPVTQDNSGIQS